MVVRIPVGAKPEAASDAHMTVVDQANGLEYDFWGASTPTNGQMTVKAGNAIPIGANTGTGLEGDAEGAYLGLLGGLVRAPELAGGRIEPALGAVVKCSEREDVWPAPSGATANSVCANEGKGPPFGSLLQLNESEAEIAASNAPAWQRAIMVALARYGAYVIDNQSRLNHEVGFVKEDDL